jgi:stearoyl-CoA desaturase (delta-9 desaturase)
MRWISRHFLGFVGLTLLVPFVLGFVLHGFSLAGALTALLWAGFVRIFFLHHSTWAINSVCHFFGRRRFAVTDRSTNVAWLALPSLGESWHHNHHAFPRSARQGLGRWEFDLSGIVIRALERTGVIWNVVRISPERQQARLAGAGAPEPERVAA